MASQRKLELAEVSFFPSNIFVNKIGLTFMLGSPNQFSDHSLNNANIAIEYSSKDPTNKSDPVVSGESDDKKGQQCSPATEKQDRFAADTVRKASPEHARQGLREGKGGYKDTGVE